MKPSDAATVVGIVASYFIGSKENSRYIKNLTDAGELFVVFVVSCDSQWSVGTDYNSFYK